MLNFLSFLASPVVRYLVAAIAVIAILIWLHHDIYSAGYRDAEGKYAAKIEAIKKADAELLAHARLEAALRAKQLEDMADESAARVNAAQASADEQLKMSLQAVKMAPVAERNARAPAWLVCAVNGDCK